ncbi:hypothetical protein KC644_02485 [Candidatus Berkelbacteria bacterium]|nr:hypothetical protein [Candidatus Berkelbacteria bacterium]
MENSVELDLHSKIGIIALAGRQSAAKIQQSVTESFKMNAEQMRLFSRIMTLVDLSELEGFDAGAQIASIRGLGVDNFDRLAVYWKEDRLGKTKAALIKKVVELSGKRDSIKFFSERDKAINWLKEELRILED